MKRRLLLWAPFFAVALALALFAAGLRKPPTATIRSRMVGQPIPAIVLAPAAPGLAGVSTAALKGRPYLLNIFASWCVPCVVEAPQLQRLKALGVPIAAVALRDKPADVTDFLRRYGNPYLAVGSDPASRVQFQLGSSGVPESFVVGADGVIRYQHIGEIRAEQVAGIAAAVRAAR